MPCTQSVQIAHPRSQTKVKKEGESADQLIRPAVSYKDNGKYTASICLSQNYQCNHLVRASRAKALSKSRQLRQSVICAKKLQLYQRARPSMSLDYDVEQRDQKESRLQNGKLRTLIEKCSRAC